MITFTGFGLAVQSWPAVLVLLLVFGVAYGYRMGVEEKDWPRSLVKNASLTQEGQNVSYHTSSKSNP